MTDFSEHIIVKKYRMTVLCEVTLTDTLCDLQQQL